MLTDCIEILTIGLPFCAFKIITGLFFNQLWLIILGGIDLSINLGNLLFLFIRKKRLMDACLFSFIIRSLKKSHSQSSTKWQDLGNSIDVVVSFTIVALMIGGSYLKDLPGLQMKIWNLSVILNVFGAGYGRISNSINNLKGKT
jgi:hypothetical protein